MTYTRRVNPHGPSRLARLGPVLIGGVAALAIASAVMAWRAWPATPEPIVSAADTTPAVVGPAVLRLPDAPVVLVFGDSWTYGSGASEPGLGYASVLGDLLGARTVVDGVRGSGYLKPGIDGGSYPERVAQLDAALDPDLVIIEGSINDRRLHPTGYREAVAQTWDGFAALYPDSSFVILGPAPHVLPVQKATARIDDDLAALAAQRGWWYISPLDDGWITPANYAAVIDSSEIGRNHPSTDGHAYLAGRVADALERMQGADAAADAG